jgi:hypothetical protein
MIINLSNIIILILYPLGETKCSTEEYSDKMFCFKLSVPFAMLNLACENTSDFKVWTLAFHKSISLAQEALRSYIYKLSEKGENGEKGERKGKEEDKKRKYFILHQDVITFHKDEKNINAVQGLIHLNDTTSMEYYDKKQRIVIKDNQLKQSIVMMFFEKLSPEPEDSLYRYTEWKKALISNLKLYSAIIQDAENLFDTTKGLPNLIKKGVLFMRPLKGGDLWDDLQFFINEREMVAVTLENGSTKDRLKIVSSYEITPNCSVFETNLGINLI